MKKWILLLVVCTTIQIAQAQLLQLQDPVSSKNFNSDKYTGIKGTPFLVDKWQHGTVITNKGNYADLELKLDLYDNKLFFNKNDASFELLDQVVAIQLFPKWPDTSNKQVFIKGMSQNNIHPDQYVQVLVPQGQVQLYRSDIKQVTEMSEINAGMVKTFYNSSRYFIKKGNQFNLIRLKKEEIMPYLAEKEAAINDFIVKNKLNLKKEIDFVQLIQAFNAL